MPNESINLAYDGQNDFAGGMVMIGDPPANGYRWAKNVVIRDGKLTTRFGMRAAFRSTQAGFQEAFYFNQEGAKYNDPSHTGFWFDFNFIGSAWGTIQGMGTFRFISDLEMRVIIVSGGSVFVHEKGEVKKVTTVDTIAVTEKVFFIQANQLLFMFRGEDNRVMQWDGSAAGFVFVPASISRDSIVNASNANYIQGRLWIPAYDDEIYVSDVLAFSDYDYVHQLFSIQSGDGDSITRILQFHEDTAIVFKKRSIHAISGINSYVLEGTTFDNYVKASVVDNEHGLVAREAVVQYGEQIAYLSYGGIYNLQRNQYGIMQGLDMPLSAPIQPLIDRINWAAVSCACATAHNNYLLFAVPIDGATANNTVLVYDLIRSAWVGEWTSEMLHPVQFIKMDEKQYFLGTDGRLRILFCEDPWDSEDQFNDTQIHSLTRYYLVGEHCVHTPSSGEKTIYRALVENINTLPTVTSVWAVETDPNNLYKVESEAWLRFMDSGDKSTGKRWQRGEIIFDHIAPKITLDYEEPAYNTVKNICTDKVYDRTKYDIIGHEDWVATNENLDFDHPRRQDYPVMVNPFINLISNGNFSDGLTAWSQTGAGAHFGATDHASVDNTGRCHIVDYGYHGSSECFLLSTTVVVPKVGSHTLYFNLWGSTLNPNGAYFYVGTNPIISHSRDVIAQVQGSNLLKVPPIAGPTWIEVAQGREFSKTIITTVANQSVTIYFTQISGATYETQMIIGNVRLFVAGDGLSLSSSGIPVGIWTSHSVRFQPFLVKDKQFALRLKNTQGRLSVKSVRLSSTLNRFAMRRE